MIAILVGALIVAPLAYRWYRVGKGVAKIVNARQAQNVSVRKPEGSWLADDSGDKG